MNIRSILLPLALTQSLALAGATFAAVSLTLASAPAHAASESAVQVALHKSEVIDLHTPVNKVSVGNPEIADIVVLPKGQIYIVGKKLGSTNVLLWNNQDRVVRTLNVDVTHDLQGLKSKLHDLMPEETIAVYSANNTIGLTGQVSSSARVATAVDVAQSFLSADGNEKNSVRVLNMLQVGGSQQVMLEVQVAEISRSLMRRLGVKFHGISPDDNFTIGAVSGGGSLVGGVLQPGEGIDLTPGTSRFIPNPLTISTTGIFGSFLDGTTLFNVAIEAAQENGLAKVLAEPTLTTMTGQEATFHAGGEFPIPVYGGPNQGTTITFKEFGIGLGFIPVVLDSGTINLKVNIRVSEISNQNAVAVNIPQTSTSFFVNSLTTRSATSTIELGSGQTMGIAGLIDETLREQVSKFPGLGDLPIIGTLFRSQEYVKGETELVILVTPHFAKANPRDAYRLPTSAFVDPDAIDFYLLGRMEGRRDKQKEENAARNRDISLPERGGAEGTFGHQI